MASSENGGFVMFPNDMVDDEELPALEKAIMLSLLRFFNKEQQRAWPSIKHLAKINGLSHVCVIGILRRLEKKGYIRAERKNGCVTKYEVFTSKRHLPAHDETDKRDLPVNDTYQSTTFTAPVNDVYCTSKRDLPVPVNDVYPIKTNDKDLNINTNYKHDTTPAKIAPKNESNFEADFEEFWRAYPKPKNPDKTPTRKRYEALRKKGVSGEDLLKAAQGYARSMQGTDPRYIKHGATFLGPQEPWRDYLTEPEPVSDEPPDAEKLFPDLAEWMRQKRSEANER